MTTNDRAIFQDEAGRGWLVEIMYGHPAPVERGIMAARFVCPEAPEEPVRIGYVMAAWIAELDEELLREALEEAEPGEAIG